MSAAAQSGSPGGQVEPWWHRLPGPVVALLNSSLARNGYALIMSVGLTSVLGVLFWVLAARHYTPEEVGRGAALISSLLTLGNLSQLNLANLLNRFMPGAGRHGLRIMAWSYTVSTVAGLLFASVFILGIGHFAGELAFLAQDPLTGLLYAAGVALWTVFVLQDSILAGLRKSLWVPVENTLYAIVKIGLLVLLAGTALGGSPIFLAWILPIPVLVVVVNLLIARAIRSDTTNAPTTPPPFSAREVAHFFGWDYVGTLSTMLAVGAAPMIVLALGGAESIANYHLAWTIAYSLYLVARSIGISLLVEGATDRARIRALAAESVLHTTIVLLLAVPLLVAAAPLVMSLFGPQYEENGVAVLRLLALSCVPWSMTTLFLAASRAEGRVKAIAAVQAATLVLMAFFGSMLVPGHAATGMGWAWLIAHSIVACGIGTYLVLRHGRGAAIDALLSVAYAASRLRGLRQVSEPQADALPAAVRAAAGIPDGAGVKPIFRHRSVSDVATVAMAPASLPGRPVVVRFSTSPQGQSSLERSVSHSARLQQDTRLATWHGILPCVIATVRCAGAVHVVERHLSGTDGQALLQRQGARAAALHQASSVLRGMHRATSVRQTISDSWLEHWVDRPAATLRMSASPLLSASRRACLIDALADSQRRFWAGRPADLGLGHRDYWIGNLLFETEAVPGGASPLRVSGIVDWDGLADDAPAGLDLCFLAIATRMQLSGCPTGPVVQELLRAPAWTAEERQWLAPADLRGDDEDWTTQPEATRAMVLLAWLQHADSVLRKSDRYGRSRLWTATNVDRVLQAWAACQGKGATL